MLEDDQYLADGLSIASGLVEGACRHWIKDRLDRAGVQKRLRRVEAVLRICSLRYSDDVDVHWRF